MSQFLKGAERKRGWKTLERNLQVWIKSNVDKENVNPTATISPGKIDSYSSSPSKIPNVYQIRNEASSESKSDGSSEESGEEVDESIHTGTSPQSPLANPGYNCWTNRNSCTPLGPMHDSIIGMSPDDGDSFHSWESVSINDMFS